MLEKERRNVRVNERLGEESFRSLPPACLVYGVHVRPYNDVWW
jgi:hypothetical protein